MSQIQEKLYLGSIGDAKNLLFLKESKITHIVTVGAELKMFYPSSFKYMYIPAMDSPYYDLKKYFDHIADFIHRAISEENGVVLVHCFWGISRSSSSVIAYLVKHQKMTPDKARQLVKAKRAIIYPNDGFWR
jgi:atypical dual specificity phosphatase